MDGADGRELEGGRVMVRKVFGWLGAAAARTGDSGRIECTMPSRTRAKRQSSFDHPATANANHIEKFSYAYASGELTSSIDQNNLTTTYKYNDSLARLTETDFPDGGQALVSYNDSPYNPSTPSPSVTTKKD
jgi:YD repeat-containing protein